MAGGQCKNGQNGDAHDADDAVLVTMQALKSQVSRFLQVRHFELSLQPVVPCLFGTSSESESCVCVALRIAGHSTAQQRSETEA